MGILTQSKQWLDALFTRTQRQLIGLFFGHPERSFYLNEVVRLAKVGTGSVQRELNRFSEAGLLVTRKIGHQRHYQANSDLPIFPELCAMARKTLGVTDTVREMLSGLEQTLDFALLYVQQGPNADASLRVLLVSKDANEAQARAALRDARKILGRKLVPWVLDRRRFRDLLARQDRRLMDVLNGPKVRLLGSGDELNWQG